MAVTFNKPKGLRYTDMCIYIDENMEKIKVPYENPEIENKIFEYLYHIVYALACKSSYFRNFSDYDSFSIYAATELYFSIRKKIINAGKEVRGKVIIPVKSSLNFIKATMFPLKINYQRDNFGEILDPAIHSSTDTLKNDLEESIQKQYRGEFIESYDDAISELPSIINEELARTPFDKNSTIFKNVYISVLLTLLNDITLPNKIRDKIIRKKTLDNRKKSETKLISAYDRSSDKSLLWHLDERYSNYIRVVCKNIKKELSKMVNFYIHGDDLSDDLISVILSNAYIDAYDLGDDD